METPEKEYTLEGVIKTLNQIAEQQKISSAEAEKQRIEAEKQRIEVEKQRIEAEKQRAETDKKIKELGKYIDSVCGDVEGIKRSNGRFAEETIYNALEKNMTFGGTKFDNIDRNVKLHIKLLNLKGEFDVVLENGDTLAIIETKYKVRREDVSELITKPDNFRKLFPQYSDYKVLLGIGGLCFDNKVIEDAQKQGIGIIKIDNDKVEYHTEGIKIY